MAADCPGTALCDEGSFASQKGVISDTSRRINRPEDCGVSANGQVGVCGARIRNGITWSPDSQYIIYVVEAPDFEELEQAGLMKIRGDGDMPTQLRTDELQNWMNPVMQLVGARSPSYGFWNRFSRTDIQAEIFLISADFYGQEHER